VALTEAGMYHVEAMANGCQYSDSILIIVNPLPETGLESQYIVCSSSDVEDITLPEFDSYAWSNGLTVGNVQLGVGDYSVTVSDNGCESVSSFVVTLNEVSLDIETEYLVCSEDDEVEISLPQFESYAWSNGATESQVTVGVGVYSVTVASDGCEASVAFSVTQIPHYEILSEQTAEICSGSTYSIELADGLSNIVWAEIETENPEYVVLSEAGMYHVSAFANGCQYADSLLLGINELPDAGLLDEYTYEITTLDTLINIDANLGFVSYLWSNGQESPSLQIYCDSLEFPYSNEFSVLVTDENGCQGEDFASVVIAYNSPVGVEDAVNGGWHLFPNPNNGHFVVDGADFNEAKIFDSNGRLVYSFTDREVSVDNLPAGNYVVRICGDDSQSEIRMIISK
ncbi:MAG: T9SS type A sorting domain-containing protein, partial [Bacteroidales bacterium]|nr:T9SS type A sorting domain-containing protein [Bacteroidales bacterium]